MTGIAPPHSLVILDRRPEYARLLAALATADQPMLAVATFDDLDEAERWLALAPVPIAVLVDVTAGDGAAIARAKAWGRERADVAVIAMFDAANENEVLLAAVAPADATLPKPCCHGAWSRSFGALMRREALATV
ncbi:MAG: hypothetical protein O2822_01755 [Chloroflexi bacterium]|nr:hypothetical protein [Chloroflexota bacterium]